MGFGRNLYLAGLTSLVLGSGVYGNVEERNYFPEFVNQGDGKPYVEDNYLSQLNSALQDVLSKPHGRKITLAVNPHIYELMSKEEADAIVNYVNHLQTFPNVLIVPFKEKSYFDVEEATCEEDLPFHYWNELDEKYFPKESVERIDLRK